jgi:L-amino acid N-acyltransferase YncA
MDDGFTMHHFKLQRADENDIPGLELLCREATDERDSLLGHRRDSLSPGALHHAHQPLLRIGDGDRIVGFAAILLGDAPLGAGKCAEGIVYVTPSSRGRGAGRTGTRGLVTMCRMMGLWKVISYVTANDTIARAMLEHEDFREVGVFAKHLQLEGIWRDVVAYERLAFASRRPVALSGAA